MILHSIEAGPVDTRGYLLADEQSREAVIVDVPMESQARFLSLLKQERLHPIAIVLTHGHFDHVGDVAQLARSLEIPVYIHQADAGMLEQPMSNFPGLGLNIEGMKPTHLLEEGDVLECGRLRLRIIHAPGHTPGHVLLYEMRENVLLSGDVLFHSSIGRTDLPGGDYDTLMESITKKVLILPDDTIVYPGHGEATTIGFEHSHNPFILEYLEHL